MLNFAVLKIQALRAHTIMASDRVKTLAVLVSAIGGPSRAARVFDYSAPSFLSQMLKGDRPITEKTARNRLEDHLVLPRGWLDRDWPSEEAIIKDLDDRRIPELVSKWLHPKTASAIPIRQFILQEGPPVNAETFDRVVREREREPKENDEVRIAVTHVYPEITKRGVFISSNGGGKSSTLIAVLKWHEIAAEMIKHELDTNAELNVPHDKAQALLQTLASLLMATEGKIPASSVRDMINLTVRPQT